MKSAKGALALSISLAALGLFTSPGLAYTHSWSCPNVTSAMYCQDVTEFHSWINVQTRIDYNLNPDSICAYAWTAAGNQRTGSGCDPHDWVRTSCLSSDTPNSHGLGNWYWPGQTHNTAGYAETPSSNDLC
jgi:hypothetical protein